MEPAGVEVLGEPHDPDLVEVEADGLGERRDEHTLAEPADAGEGRLELDGENLLEPQQGRRKALGVQRGETGQHALHHTEGVLLLERQAPAAVLGEEGVEQVESPATERVPRRGTCGVVEPALERR